MWATFRNGGIFAGLVLAVEHSYMTQVLGAFLAFATVFWTEWVREYFRRLRDRKTRRPRRRKAKEAV